MDDSHVQGSMAFDDEAEIISLHGMPTFIMLDKDPHFTLIFGELAQGSSTKLKCRLKFLIVKFMS